MLSWFVWFLAFASSVERANVDLVAQVLPAEFGISSSLGAGVWGFSDPLGTPYVVMATDQGTAVFDISDPANPMEIGMVPGLNQSGVRDVMGYLFVSEPGNFVARIYVTCEETTLDDAEGGFQIIDAGDVPNGITIVDYTFLPPGHPGFTSIRGMTVGVKPTGYLGYLVGTDRAAGGIIALDLSTLGVEDQPRVLAEWDQIGFVYDLFVGNVWSDPVYDGSELGIAFAGTSFYVVDLTDFYDGDPMTNDMAVLPGYSAPSGLTENHTGWVTEDGRYLIACDQGDEPVGPQNTRLRVFDLTDLTQPVLTHTWTGDTQAIDHHALISGNYLYLSNATAGLVFFDILNPPELSVFGDYDTFPAHNLPELTGAWESFFFPITGILALSDRVGGLFLLDPQVPEDRCRALDLEADGFDADDFTLRLPWWRDEEDVVSLSGLVRCL